MSFFKRLFGRKTPDKVKYIEAMAEMAAESERTYRSMIDTYNSDIELGLLSTPDCSTVVPTARGIYKARLFGSLFMVMAYAKSTQSMAESEEMMNIATGVALEPLQEPDVLCLDRDEAKAFTMTYLITTFKAMTAAFAAGPLLPGAARPEHIALADQLHDALAESIGTKQYTPEMRERFAVMVHGNTAMSMNHAGRWIVP